MPTKLIDVQEQQMPRTPIPAAGGALPAGRQAQRPSTAELGAIIADFLRTLDGMGEILAEIRAVAGRVTP
jgi:hypothetical protein